MQVVKYLIENGLDKLVDEFKIVVTDYDNYVVLNYDQINSVKNNAIVDECRALILRKGTWEVLARSFNRFYNHNEIAGFEFDVRKSLAQTKLDGSLISLWNLEGVWHVSTRKMAHAEGKTTFGMTFKELFDKAAESSDIPFLIEHDLLMKGCTYVFELTSPFNRIVTPYSDCRLTLLTIRDNKTGEEFSIADSDASAKYLRVNRPKMYSVKNMNDVEHLIEELGTLDEGFVLTIESNPSHIRVKCKNARYLAVSHMRENGQISPKHIITLIKTNETAEYLNYFPEDSKFISFVQTPYDEMVKEIQSIWNDCKDIEVQKDYALAIIPRCKNELSKGILFQMRKDRTLGLADILKDIDSKKIVFALKLDVLFKKEFGFGEEDS